MVSSRACFARSENLNTTGVALGRTGSFSTGRAFLYVAHAQSNAAAMAGIRFMGRHWCIATRVGSSLVGRRPLLQREVALLVLLAAPAGARVVAAHPRPRADDGRGLVLHHRAALAARGGGRLAVDLDG